jgi:3-oxoacyl-[acyl-carrier protein] reductase
MSDISTAKVVLITGALSDIGRATALAFARLGHALVLNYRHHPEKAQALADLLTREAGAPRALAIQADVRRHAEVQSLFAQAGQAFGRVDVLVNNAGINRDQTVVGMSEDEWETVVSTILNGTFWCSQEFARQYTGVEGNIINIGALTALKGRKNGANYCSARAAVLALTKCMALELAPHIRVNTVTPGRIDTEELQTRYQTKEPENRARLVGEIPLARLGQPEEVASMIAFVVSAGQYLTGQNFIVDGGLYMR